MPLTLRLLSVFLLVTFVTSSNAACVKTRTVYVPVSSTPALPSSTRTPTWESSGVTSDDFLECRCPRLEYGLDRVNAARFLNWLARDRRFKLKVDKVCREEPKQPEEN